MKVYSALGLCGPVHEVDHDGVLQCDEVSPILVLRGGVHGGVHGGVRMAMNDQNHPCIHSYTTTSFALDPHNEQDVVLTE